MDHTHRIALTLGLLLSLPACGFGAQRSCQEACDRLYDDGGEGIDPDDPDAEPDPLTNDCAITRPGREKPDLIELCMEECVGAMATEGDLGGYDPYAEDNQAIQLVTESQAELWMECVAETSCDDLRDGDCAPVY